MNLSEIRSQVKGLFGITDSSKDSKIDAWINFAQTELADYHDWSFLKVAKTGTFTSGTYSYTFDSEVHRLLSFRVTGSHARSLRFLDHLGYDRKYPKGPQAEGVPYFFVPFGVSYFVVPKPDDSYPWEQRYVKWPTKLVGDTDVTDFVNRPQLVVYMAAVHGGIQMGMLDQVKHLQTILYNHYPLGQPRKRGLLEQAVRDDRNRPYEVWTIEPYNPSGTDGRSSEERRADPMVGL